MLFSLCVMAQGTMKNRSETFSSGSGLAGAVSFTFGQPFFQEVGNEGSVSAYPGIQQAQLIRVILEEETCENEGYAQNGFSFDPPLTPGEYSDSQYSWTAQYNYDSITELNLVVWPIFELADTLKLDRSELAEKFPGYILHDGVNDITWQTIHGCDSLVHYMIFTCGDTIADIDGNIYNSRFVGPYCWTLQNARSTHYDDGSELSSMIYESNTNNNLAENLETYGRLYNWYAAVNLPEGSSAMPAVDTLGFVKGLCPEGWHIPTEENMASLLPIGAPELKSENLWIIPGTNGTQFSALPAGLFNPNTNRFENLHGETHFWSDQPDSDTKATNIVLRYNCDDVMFENGVKYYGFSVRCVKNQIF